MVEQGVAHPFPCHKAVGQEKGRGHGETVDYGNEGIHLAQLKQDGEPGGSPDKDDTGVEEEVQKDSPVLGDK